MENKIHFVSLNRPEWDWAFVGRHACRLLLPGVIALAVAARTVSAIELPEPVCGAIMLAYDAPPADWRPADLTGLSLEQLYNLDIVQPNILGGHTHPAGQAMFGVEYMHTSMSGLYQGTHEISSAAAFSQGFGTVHTSMDMDMYMFNAMYAPAERLTLMAMLPYKMMSMEHLTSAGKTFHQSDDGIGDLEIMAMTTVLGDIRKGGTRMILNTGLSLPTGAIDASDHALGDPTMAPVQLEYLMQLGSGTYDLMPGLTYLGEAGKWSWGAQTLETVRLGRNYHNYRLGNNYRISGWASYGLTDWFAPSLRLDGNEWKNISGADPGLAKNTTPEAKPYLRAGERVDILFGLNFYAPNGLLRGTRLMIEGGLPVYQNLAGPQLGTAWMLSAGFTYAF